MTKETTAIIRMSQKRARLIIAQYKSKYVYIELEGTIYQWNRPRWRKLQNYIKSYGRKQVKLLDPLDKFFYEIADAR